MNLRRSVSTSDGSSYNCSTLIQRSVELSEPIIYVKFSYHLNAFGRLDGGEALPGGVANVGLDGHKYHFDDIKLSWLLTLSYFDLNADG